MPVLCSVTELPFVAQGLLDGEGFCEGEGFVLGAVDGDELGAVDAAGGVVLIIFCTGDGVTL